MPHLLHTLLLTLFPKIYLHHEAKKLNVDKRLEACIQLFDNAKRIDFFPLTGGSRGFMLVIDNAFSMWFYQDGDKFVFDGYEMGEYEDGEVTVLDDCRDLASPFK